MKKKTKLLLLALLSIVILTSFVLLLLFGKKGTIEKDAGEKDKISVEQQEATDKDETGSGADDAGTQDEIVLPQDDLENTEVTDGSSAGETTGNGTVQKPNSGGDGDENSNEDETTERNPIVLPAIPLG